LLFHSLPLDRAPPSGAAHRASGPGYHHVPAGQLEGRFGLPGKGLERVVLSTELDGGWPTISFQVKNGNSYKLELVKEDWLSGTMILTGGNRSGQSPDRPIQLERKK
jgi:hypothetical protein